VFLEPTCPFSIRAFGKLEDLLDKAGEDRITVKVPTVAALAHVLGRDRALHSGRLDPRSRKGGRESVMAAVAPHREEFEFDRHCSGPNLDATPNDIIRRIERYSGVKRLADFHGRRAGPARHEPAKI
jgi:hypothetical protein